MKRFLIRETALLILLASLLGAASPTTVLAQTQPNLQRAVVLSRTAECCADYPFTLTIAAQDMMNSIGKVVAGAGTKCHPVVSSVLSAMPAEYVQSGKQPGIVTYGAFFKNAPSGDGIEGPDRVRVTWASAANNALGYSYYGVCKPDPIVFPAGMGENHVYWVKFVPVERYKAYTGPDKSKLDGYLITQISGIANVFIESKTGYMATQEKDAYNATYSSKGVVAVIRLQNNQLMPCYVINNYEGNQLMWKKANNCAGL